MYLRIRSYFVDWKDHRQSLLPGVTLALVVLFIFTSAFPIGSLTFEMEEDAEEDAPLVLTAAAAYSAIPLPALVSRTGSRAREGVHVRAGRTRRNSTARGLDPARGISVSLIVFLHLIAGLLLTSGRQRAFQPAEYLRSHIGEKRPGDGMPASPVASLLRVYSVTVLHAAPSLFYFFRGLSGWPFAIEPLKRR